MAALTPHLRSVRTREASGSFLGARTCQLVHCIGFVIRTQYSSTESCVKAQYSQSLLPHYGTPQRVLGDVYCWASVVSTCSYVFAFLVQSMVELDLKRSTLRPWCLAVCGHVAWPLQVGAWAPVGFAWDCCPTQPAPLPTSGV